MTTGNHCSIEPDGVTITLLREALSSAGDVLSYDLSVSKRLGCDPDSVWSKAMGVHRRQGLRLSKLGLPAPAVTPVQIVRLWNATGWRCIYTWQRCMVNGGVHPLNMTLDHIVPIKYGAPTSVSNLVPACLGYNNLKSADRLERFLKHVHVSRKTFNKRRNLMLERFVYMSHQSALWADLTS